MFKCCYCNIYLIQDNDIVWDTFGECPECNEEIFVNYTEYTLDDEYGFSNHIAYNVKRSGSGEEVDYIKI